MNKNIIIGVLIIALVGVGGVVLLKKIHRSDDLAGSLENSNYQPPSTSSAPSTIQDSSSTSPANEVGVKEFTVTGANFSFDPATITVNKGDRVKINFKNSEGMHDFVLDDFNVKSNRIQAGQDTTVEFTADKAGTFEYYCSVGTHRQMGMKGTLMVK